VCCLILRAHGGVSERGSSLTTETARRRLGEMRQPCETPPARTLGAVERRAERPNTSTRGILRPLAGFDRFKLSRVPPPDDLAPFVVWFWTVRWDLPDGQRYAQEVLPFPGVHLA